MKIGIYGSAAGNHTEEIKEKARTIGIEIARRGHTVLTGGSTGLPYEAVLGASQEGGICIGFSPAVDVDHHVQQYGFPTKGFTEFVFIPKDYSHKNNPAVCKKYRNVASVAASDAVIIVGGRIGTMNEFTIAYDLGKRIGILEKTGGITKSAIKTLLEDAAKESDAIVVWDPDPTSLVSKILKEK